MSITFSPEYVPGDPPRDYDNDTYLNVSNSNAHRILAALGIEPDYCGCVEAADLAGRVLTAMAVGHTDIVDPVNVGEDTIGPNGARFIECAPALDEYLASRLPALLAVANEAMALGREVQWG